MSSVRDLIRQCISPFITGPEVDALLDTITDEALRQEEVSLTSYDQIFLSTASAQYLDKKASELGLIRPEDLGIDDLTFRNIAIDITATKQIPTLIHSVLETFYGVESVRTFAISKNAEPYQLEEGMQLLIRMDGKDIIYEVDAEDFPPASLSATTVASLAAALTKEIRRSGSQGFADIHVDPDTNIKYLRIVSGVRGPTGLIRIEGGELQRVVNFQNLIEYPATTPLTWTSWVINRKGSTVRFSWLGNADPHLEVVREGDKVLIYGDNFTGVGSYSTDLRGSFVVTKVQMGGVWSMMNPDSAAYFEIENPDVQMGPSENITVSQGTHEALRFYRAKTFRPYLRPRYALAWEPNGKELRIYLPAVTKVVRRGLEGAAHIRFGRSNNALLGNWGSATVDAERLVVINDYSFKFAQNGLDISGFGGQVSYGMTTVDIDYVKREDGFVTVVCKDPHGISTIASTVQSVFNSANSYYEGNIVEYNGFLYTALQDNPAPSVAPSSLSYWGKYNDDSNKSNQVVTLSNIPEVDDLETFNGPYTYDRSARYQLSGTSGELLQDVRAGNSYRTVSVSSTEGIPDDNGFIMMDLNSETEEGPIPIVGTLSNALLLSPAYKFKHTHTIGDNFIYLTNNRLDIGTKGEDFPFYATGTAAGRIYCQDLLNQVTALGIKLSIIIVYPDGTGYGYGEVKTDGSDYRNNDLVWIYGE
jgi:hypothetical protein